MKTKLFAIALTLCLAVSAFAGMSALAAEEMETRVQRWAEYMPQCTVDGISTVSKGDFIMCATPAVLDPSATYQISFRYATSSNTAAYMIADDNGGVGYTIKAALPATYEVGGDKVFVTHTTTLIPDKDSEGRPSLRTPGLRIYLYGPTEDGATIEIDDNEPYQTKFVKLTAAEATSNGSAEIVEEGNAVNISGGKLITEGARDGQNMMKVTAGDPMTMNLVMPAKGEVNSKIRGFMKADGMTDGSAVTVTFYRGSLEGLVLATKTYTYSDTDAAFNDIQNGVWEYLRFSGMMMAGQIVAKFEVTGAGSVYVDGITLEEDKNLIPDSRFTQGDTTWELSNVTVGTDGNCPDGQYYAAFGGLYANMQARDGITFFPVEENTRYEMSLWYKTDGLLKLLTTCIGSNSSDFSIKNGDTWDNYTIANESDEPFLLQLNPTADRWERISILLTVPSGITQLKIFVMEYAQTENTKLCNLSVEKVGEKTIRFYEPRLLADGGGALIKPLEPYNIPFYTVLGKPVEAVEDVTAGEDGAIATCLTPVLDGDMQKLSTDRMIYATYKTAANGVQTLTGIQIGDAASYGSSHLPGVDCTTNADKFSLRGKNDSPLQYMNYPSVLVPIDALKASGTTTRVFCWDSLQGLKAISDVAFVR